MSKLAEPSVAMGLTHVYLGDADPCTNRQRMDEYCKSLLRFRVLLETPSRCSC
jgi:hypothetical protein